MTKESARAKLDFNIANAIFRNFLPIGGAVFEYMASLQDAGFSAFVPYNDFVQSFGQSTADVEIHRRVVIEEAKNFIGRPFPLVLKETEGKHLFSSSFIEQLTRKRDEENGVPEAQLFDRHPGEIWRLEIDPCRKRCTFENINNRQEFEIRWSASRQAERRQLELESRRHATGISQSYKMEMRPQRYAFFVSVMAQNASTLGFTFDALKSRPRYPVFSKTISADWDLCLALEEAPAFYSSKFKGRFNPWLEIRNRNLVGSLESGEPGDFLLIRYDRIVPGFRAAYGEFLDLDELETMIKAHLQLYLLIALTIEDGLKKALSAL